VIIIGGGVLGVSLAYHLSQRSVRSVLLEKEPSYGHHASGRNAGMMRQLYRNPQLTEWARRSIRSWPDKIRRKAFTQTGSTILGRKPCEHHPELFRETAAIVRGKNIGGVLTSSDGLLDPHPLLSGLLAESRSYCSEHYRHEVISLSKTSADWTVECRNGDKFTAPWVVNATGAWINKILKNNYPQLSLKTAPFARHLFVVDGWKTNKYLSEEEGGYFWDETGGWYMRRWTPTARLFSVCDMQQMTPENYQPDEQLELTLAKLLCDLFPHEAQDLRIGSSWHCFRTYTADQLPVWGKDTDCPGFFWLAAFGGYGMSTSFAAAEDAAEVIAADRNILYSEFCPSRVRHELVDAASEET
ncbi:MAG: FAD-dependent oxidoreductase, partial [bacterium]|nr:FAD-dependent oxidoreductase [bacterium]